VSAGDKRIMSTLVVVDDDPTVLVVFRGAFKDSDVTVVTAETAAAGLAAVNRHRPDVILLDVHLPDGSGLELFGRLRAADATVPVIFITADGSSDTVIQAMRQGAFDYLQKPLDLPATRALLARALESRRRMHRPVALGTPVAPGQDVFIGSSASMQEVYKAIGRVAPLNVTVLIRGESGTGKELVARALYQHSDRARQPFLAINCAAIPEALLESELFGHEKGAFTGADRRRVGKFEQCHGGTLLLDEIGDMPLALQAKMLRVLQEQRFERLGGGAPLETDVRLIAATHQDLEALIVRGRFRADLYYRLKGFVITMPPLRERPEDLPALVAHLLERLRPLLGHPVEQVDPEVLARLQRHTWPGNVRELEGCLKQALLQARGQVLTAVALPPELTRGEPAGAAPADREADALLGYVRQRLAAGSTDLYAEALRRLEETLVREVLAHTGGNQAQAARLLGIARNSLRKKILELGITLERVVGGGADDAELGLK
jgi:two-component system nitrogen regulation response regulator GlnG